MKISLLQLSIECKRNVMKQYPEFDMEDWASWMCWLMNHTYNEQIKSSHKTRKTK